MKRVGVITTALVFVFFGTSVFGYAQHDQQGEKHGRQEGQAEHQQQRGNHQQSGHDNQQRNAQHQQGQNDHQQHAQQRERGQLAQRQQHQDPNGRQQHSQQQMSGAGQQRVHSQHAQIQRTQEQRHAQRGEQRGAWQQHRAHVWESEHRTWQQRGGYNGYRINDVYFRGHYGRDHFFRVYSLPFMQVGGNPRFQYGGYWFSPVDPYPEYWAANWYQNDDVYVDYRDNGYYLYNRRYPTRPGVAISISF